MPVFAGADACVRVTQVPQKSLSKSKKALARAKESPLPVFSGADACVRVTQVPQQSLTRSLKRALARAKEPYQRRLLTAGRRACAWGRRSAVWASLLPVSSVWMGPLEGTTLPVQVLRERHQEQTILTKEPY